MVAASSGHYSNKSLTGRFDPNKVQRHGTTVYTKVVFSEPVAHWETDTPTARPEIFYKVGNGTPARFDVVGDEALPASGDCKRRVPGDNTEYLCLYTVTRNDKGAFTFEVGTRTRDLDNYAMEQRYTHATIVELGPNQPPKIGRAIPNQSARAGETFSYTIPGSAFNDANGDTLNYRALWDSRADWPYGAALPNWIRFDPESRTFSGTPAASDVDSLSVKVIASDGIEQVRDVFYIEIQPAIRSTAPLMSNLDQGWRLRTQRNRMRQTFYTGPNSDGYTVTAVELARYDRGSLWTDDTRTRLSICTKDSPEVCTALTPPSTTRRGADTMRFTVNGTYTLAASTWYDLLITGVDRYEPPISVTQYSNLDNDSLPGWEVWWPRPRGVTAARFALYGSANNAAAAPTSADSAIAVAPGRSYALQVSNFSFTQASENATALTGIEITRVPGRTRSTREYIRGSLTLDGEDIYPPYVVSNTAIDARRLVYNAPRDAPIGENYDSFQFRVRDANNASATTYTMRVNIADSSGQVAADPPVITAVPTVSGAGDDGEWSEGETVELSFVFNEAVEVDTAGGTPFAEIDVGFIKRRNAAYVRGTGTETLAFAYTLTKADGTHRVMAVPPDSVILDGATIRSQATGVDATLTHNGTIVAGTRDTRPSARFENAPQNHDGESAFTLTLAFSDAPDALSPKRDAANALEVSGGAITKARQAAAREATWELTITPTGDDDVTVRVPARSCDTAHAVCMNGRALAQAVEVTIEGPEERDNAITAQVTQASASHDGNNPFPIVFAFSHEPQSLGYRTVRDDLFDVTGGRIVKASRRTQGENRRWHLEIQPDGDDAVTINARATSDCDAAYAICDGDGRMFDGAFEHTVPGPQTSSSLPTVGISTEQTEVAEGEDVVVTLSRTGSTQSTLTAGFLITENGDVLRAQRPSTLEFAEGESEATLRIATVDDDVDEPDSTVRVTVTSGHNYRADTDPQSVWVQVKSEDLDPITAQWATLHDEHEGAPFTLEFEFSREPARYSYKSVRDQLFEVTGASITRARRVVKRSNLAWELTLAPQGFDPVTLSARETTDCAAEHAVCDTAGRMFDGDLHATVQGPPTLSVADATVEEAEDATLDFVVTLSRALSQSVTVGYATADDTASAGADYTETAGTLTFAAQETSKTVSVPVLDDAHDEGTETMTLTLSGPTPQRVKLEDASAQGQITNDDRMPQAWTARFGRTVAEQAMEAVEGRFNAPRTPGGSGNIAGFSLAQLTDEAHGQRAHEADAQDGVETLSGWLAGEDSREPEARTLSAHDVLTGSSFSMTGGSARTGFTSLWGRGAVSRFDGQEGEMTLDGEVASAMLGADFSHDAHVAGLMLSHTRGEGGYRSPAGDGEVDSTLTALFPYARIEASERLALWGLAGYGAGTLTLTPEGEPALCPDLSLLMGAVGARGVLAGEEGGSMLALKADAMATRTSTDVVSSSNGGNLAASDADVTRVRLALEGAHPVGLGASAVLTPSLELGVRHDGGDAETGFGTDIGAGLALSDPTRGLSSEIHVRGLLTHEAKGFEAHGLSGTFSFDPRPGDDRGLSLSLTQTMGEPPTGGAHALLERTTLAGLGAQDGGGLDARRLDARVEYGFGIFEQRYTAIPQIGLGVSENAREIRLGWRLAEKRPAGLAFDFGIEGTRRERNDATSIEHSFGIEAGWTFTGKDTESLELRLEARRHEAARNEAEHNIGVRLGAQW